MLLIFGLIPLLEELGIHRYYVYPFVLVLPILLTLGRKIITRPRYGLVKFSSRKTSVIKKKLFILVAAAVLLTWIPFILTMTNVLKFQKIPLNSYLFFVLVGTVCIIFLSLFAIIISYNRLYIAGILIGMGVPLAELLREYVSQTLHGLMSIGAAGIILFIIGIFDFRRFLKKYPPVREEV